MGHTAIDDHSCPVTVVVTEGPDDETAAKLVLKIGSLGAIRTETMRAFPEEEYRKIIAAIP